MEVDVWLVQALCFKDIKFKMENSSMCAGLILERCIVHIELNFFLNIFCTLKALNLHAF